MIYFAKDEGTRLVDLRAIEGGFPFYGRIETDPTNAAEEFHRTGGALLEESLLAQFGAQAGDEIRLGNIHTHIAGAIRKVPGEGVALATLAPRVFVPMADLASSGLLARGSLARYRVAFKFDPGKDPDQIVKDAKPQLDKFRLRAETVADRKRELGQSMDDLYHFLNLGGFIALLLGAVGVASAIHVHVKQKLTTVALLRCLGGTVAQTFAVYLAQGMGLGLFGATIGAAIGVAAQSALPRMLADFVPFNFEFHTSWAAIAGAVAAGFVICLLFALLPLLAVRRVPPLAALRAAYETAQPRRDPLWLAAVGCLIAGVLIFLILQTRSWKLGLGFAGGLAVAFAILAGIARCLMFAAKRFAFAALPFTWRQGFANLHRPNNRTLVLLLSLGLGTFLMLTLYLVQQTLLTQLVTAGGPNQANTVFFDIQPDQRDAVARLVRSFDLPVLDEVPIITMRLQSLKGRTVESILADKPERVPRWSLRHEYRSTYSDHLRDGERIIAGQWCAAVTNNPDVTPISMEVGLAKELQLGLGDEVVFDIQGVPVTTRIANLREVNWRRVQPNFFVVFPRGVLEDAPAMHVITTRVPSAEVSARLQREIVKQFPNVSAIDLRLVLQTLDSIIGKISFVIRFMAMFTVATGLLVLAGALLTGRYQRIQEAVLLRTLGASRGQVLRILFAEYAALGLLSALTGIVLSVAAAWTLCHFVFDVHFAWQIAPLLVAAFAVPALTTATGLLMSRGVLNQPPLAVLRAEHS